MKDINFKDYLGKTITEEVLKEFNFYHYLDGECPSYVEIMKEEDEDYDETLINEELPSDCWVTRKYIPEGCCITANAVLIFVIDDKNTIIDISYMVEYVHKPGDFVPMMDLDSSTGNWYGFQGLNTPYMIEDYFEKIMNRCN